MSRPGKGCSCQRPSRQFGIGIQNGSYVSKLFPAGAKKEGDGINFDANATGEEWAYFRNGTGINSMTPEPATGFAGLIIAGALLTMRPRRRPVL